MNVRKRPKCKVKGCKRLHTAKGFCEFHYRRNKRGINVNSTKRPLSILNCECSASKCNLPIYCSNYCSKHYSRYRRSGDVNKSKRFFWKNDTEKYLWHNAKARAKRLKLEFNIPKGCLVVPDFCPVLKIQIIPGRNKGKFTDNSPSIDRIDNDKGYVIGNVHVISYLANRIKTNATVDQIMRVALYFKELHERVE